MCVDRFFGNPVKIRRRAAAADGWTDGGRTESDDANGRRNSAL